MRFVVTVLIVLFTASFLGHLLHEDLFTSQASLGPTDSTGVSPLLAERMY